ncbi:MAG TPA: prepilin peptidase [Sphingomicrobium sp.]|jgi:prepilin peptidase CpaA|nr:prepilin peptidase [Sphingomicrobium sp.]
MSLAILAPEWVRALLLALLAAAALEDAVRLRISNLVSAAVLVLAFVAIAVVGPQPGLWQNAAVFAATLVVGTLLFARGVLGGGDVKLLAATALWFDLGGAFRLLVCVALAGGLLALFILGLRLVRWSEGARERVVILKAKGGIPYGIAIAVGAAAAVMFFPPSEAQPQPAPPPSLPVLPS